MTQHPLPPWLCYLGLLALLAFSPGAAAEPASFPRRALVVGIGRYQSPDADPRVAERRRLVDLRGAGNDAAAMSALLASRGYRVTTLIDRAATRAAILDSIASELEAGLRRDDDLVFYFAGHGSQVAGSDAEESDGLDETLVPADAASGAPDLRDDELRSRFGHLLARGARLTVVVDACHSGSAFRGLPAAAASRSIEPAPPAAEPPPSEAAAGSGWTPPLEDGDFLLLAAAQDEEKAFETADGRHGLFTRALLDVLATAGPGEGAGATLRRAQSLILASGRSQHPLLAGAPPRFGQPLFAAADDGGRRQAEPGAAVIAAFGPEVLLEGGSAQGLRVGDELVRGTARLRLDRVDPVRSRASRLGQPAPLAAGDYFLRQGGSARHAPDLVVRFAASRHDDAELLRLHRKVERRVAASGLGWVSDPWRERLTHVLSYDEDRGWLLRDRQGRQLRLGRSPTAGLSGRLARLPPDSRVFLLLPLPAGSGDDVALGRDRTHDSVERARGEHTDPHYELIGRVADGRLLYSWSRSEAGDGDLLSPLPARTRELAYGAGDDVAQGLTQLALKLASLRFWLTVEGPAEARFPYRLALRESSSGDFVDASGRAEMPAQAGAPPPLRLGEQYGLVLRADAPLPARRYVYVVLLGADGRRTLLFPRPGFAGENRLPLPSQASLELPREVLFGAQPMLRISEPLGWETYLLLTTDEPLPDPMVLDSSGVRAPREGDDPLVRMLLRHQTGRGDIEGPAPLAWSVDRLAVRVVAAPTPDGS